MSPVAPSVLLKHLPYDGTAIPGGTFSRRGNAPAGAQQLAFQERALTALAACPCAKEVADIHLHAGPLAVARAREIVSSDPCRMLASRVRACAPKRQQCRQLICMHCRRNHIMKRAKLAIPDFLGHPVDRVYWVTILLSAERQLFEPTIITNVLDPCGVRLPTRREVGTIFRSVVHKGRHDVDRAVRTLKPIRYIAEGAFELSVVDPVTCGAQKARFLQDLGYPTGEAADPGSDLVLLHLHFAVVIETRNGYATGAEISAALAHQFPHRHQVLVMPIDRRKPLNRNLVDLTSYAWKTHTNFRTDRVVETARVLEAVGIRGLSFERRRGVGRSSSSMKAKQLLTPVRRSSGQ